MKIDKSKYASSGSKVLKKAVSGRLMRSEKNRLARECAKLDPAFEQMVVEEDISTDLEEWPGYH